MITMKRYTIINLNKPQSSFYFTQEAQDALEALVYLELLEAREDPEVLDSPGVRDQRVPVGSPVGPVNRGQQADPVTQDRQGPADAADSPVLQGPQVNT